MKKIFSAILPVWILLFTSLATAITWEEQMKAEGSAAPRPSDDVVAFREVRTFGWLVRTEVLRNGKAVQRTIKRQESGAWLETETTDSFVITAKAATAILKFARSNKELPPAVVKPDNPAQDCSKANLYIVNEKTMAFDHFYEYTSGCGQRDLFVLAQSYETRMLTRVFEAADDIAYIAKRKNSSF